MNYDSSRWTIIHLLTLCLCPLWQILRTTCFFPAKWSPFRLFRHSMGSSRPETMMWENNGFTLHFSSCNASSSVPTFTENCLFSFQEIDSHHNLTEPHVSILEQHISVRIWSVYEHFLLSHAFFRTVKNSTSTTNLCMPLLISVTTFPLFLKQI